MKDDKILAHIHSSLEKKAEDSANTIIALSSQGYFVNAIKKKKLNVFNILISALYKREIFDNAGKASIINLFNKL